MIAPARAIIGLIRLERRQLRERALRGLAHSRGASLPAQILLMTLEHWEEAVDPPERR